MKRSSNLFCIFLGIGIGIVISRRESLKILMKFQYGLLKYKCLFGFAVEWLSAKQNDKNIGECLRSRGYQSIAVYGMGYLGERLVDELAGSGVEIRYAIDKDKKNTYADIEIKKMEDKLSKVDAIVVTPIYDFWEIEPSLADRFKCPIISLEDIVCDGAY